MPPSRERTINDHSKSKLVDSSLCRACKILAFSFLKKALWSTVRPPWLVQGLPLSSVELARFWAFLQSEKALWSTREESSLVNHGAGPVPSPMYQRTPAGPAERGLPLNLWFTRGLAPQPLQARTEGRSHAAKGNR
ncbi:hypothetical protein CDV31_013074 [Fusarium ambrosium]|uniref:Uncharacterized protein n=1 Tax=Fusarium ambrosium TaxID=131363 RepID=A0A428T5L3_9HYPO|nr:hypothetical protein CDV31_013074 [Fusarium ambrosium]